MMDTVSAPPMPGGAGSLLAGFARLILSGLVLVTPLVLFRFLLLVAFVLGLLPAGLILAGLLAGLLARFLAGLLARLLEGLFWAVFVHAGLLARFVCAAVFVVGGAFLLPLTESDFLGVEAGFFLGC